MLMPASVLVLSALFSPYPRPHLAAGIARIEAALALEKTRLMSAFFQIRNG